MRSAEAWLASLGEVFVTIAGHDSGCTSYGVTTAAGRRFVKVAPRGSRWQVDGARRFHARVAHPAIVPLLDFVELADEAAAVVYPWLPGENLHDPQVPGALPREHPDSALSRFRALDDTRSWAAYDALLDAHLAVTAAGLVAVDLYDGCLLVDLDTGELHLIDLDLYAEPYHLDLDRQYGSTRLMPPEELTRGAWIDQRATVFTLARLADHLGCTRTPGQRAVVQRATRPDPDDRWPDVAAFVASWREG